MKKQIKKTILETVQTELRARVGSWREIAKASGVPYSTVSKIGQQQTTNPTINNIQPLVDYFNSH